MPPNNLGENRAPLMAGSVVVAAQPLAAQAGLQILARGGNAVDAAIACAATLMVVEPVSSGLGADAFALIHSNGKVHALNGSGCSPHLPIPGFDGGEIPGLGWPSVTVPGAVSAWQLMSERFGRLPFADLFEPAIRYAANGFQVTPLVARIWRGLRAMYLKFPELSEYYYGTGRGPDPGEKVAFPELARTLALIANSGGEAFYRGELAERISDYSCRSGGHLRFADLASHRAEWVSPISGKYRGLTVYEMPPNSQGIAALIALAILEEFDPPTEPDSAQWTHLQVESMKLAFAEIYDHVADPVHMALAAESLLAPERISRLRSQVDARRAGFPQAEKAAMGGGTSYLACCDSEGMAVSYIQSSGPGFGSGILVPGTGIALQNRAVGFAANPRHPNAYAPGKRVFHTNSPALALRDGQFFASFGLMGWSMQPQAHLQFVSRAVDFAQSPSAILDAPRWRIALEEPAILLETGLKHQREALTDKGHQIVATEKFLAASTPFGSHLMFGGAGYIQALPDGYAAATDPRRDGAAVGF